MRPTLYSEYRIFYAEDLRLLFDALQVARPDLREALDIVRVALGQEEAPLEGPCITLEAYRRGS